MTLLPKGPFVVCFLLFGPVLFFEWGILAYHPHPDLRNEIKIVPKIEGFRNTSSISQAFKASGHSSVEKDPVYFEARLKAGSCGSNKLEPP